MAFKTKKLSKKEFNKIGSDAYQSPIGYPLIHPINTIKFFTYQKKDKKKK